MGLVGTTLVVGPAANEPARAALPAPCSGTATTVTCTFTADGTFKVPSFVTSLTVEAVGGNGAREVQPTPAAPGPICGQRCRWAATPWFTRTRR